ncbi:hypothetical protein BpHYR1_029187, partial [Brachionus plicatilis]
LNFGLIVYNFRCNRVNRFNPFEPHIINRGVLICSYGFYQNFSNFTGIPHFFTQIFRKIVKKSEKKYIYFSNLTSRHFSQLQFQLPNLNPIEMLWNEMKEFAREKIVFTIADAALAIREFEKSLAVEKCSTVRF